MRKTLKNCIANGTASEWLIIMDSKGTHRVYSCSANICRHKGWYGETDFCAEKLMVEKLEKLLKKPL